MTKSKNPSYNLLLLPMLKSIREIIIYLPQARTAIDTIYSGVYEVLHYCELSVLSHRSFFELYKYECDVNETNELDKRLLLDFLLSFTTINIYNIKKENYLLNMQDLNKIYGLIYKSREKSFDGLIEDHFIYSQHKLLEMFINRGIICVTPQKKKITSKKDSNAILFQDG